MRISKRSKIRQVLRETGGLTVSELSKRVGYSDSKSALTALKSMPDTYIDRWNTDKQRWSAVWCVVDVPPDCPRPDRKGKKHDNGN